MSDEISTLQKINLRNFWLLRLLLRLYELPPKDVLLKVRKRFRPSKGEGPDIEEILSNPTKIRPQRLYDFLSRYQAIIRRQHSWNDLTFEGKNVLEIGCGPLLGWGPMAVFLDCENFTCVDPHINKDIIRTSTIIERYFLPIYKDLSALYGPRKDFDRFVTDLFNKTTVFKQKFTELQLQRVFNITLSNSCLEHIFPLDVTIRKLREISTADCRFLHLVDFGNHRSTHNPFESIYEIESDAYFSLYGKNINLLRCSDVLRLFQDNGFDAAAVPYYFFEDFFEGRICPYWSEHYHRSELFLKTAIIAGPFPSKG